MSRNAIRAGVLLCALVVALPALAWKLVEEGTPLVHKTGY